MKKFKVFYIIIVLLIIIMAFKGNFTKGRMLYSYNDYLDYGIIDGFSGSVYLYDINLIIIGILFIVNLVITIINSDKFKWLIFVVISVFLLSIPLGYHSYSGGLVGGIHDEYIYIWNSQLLNK